MTSNNSEKEIRYLSKLARCISDMGYVLSGELVLDLQPGGGGDQRVLLRGGVLHIYISTYLHVYIHIYISTYLHVPVCRCGTAGRSAGTATCRPTTRSRGPWWPSTGPGWGGCWWPPGTSTPGSSSSPRTSAAYDPSVSQSWRRPQVGPSPG